MRSIATSSSCLLTRSKLATQSTVYVYVNCMWKYSIGKNHYNKSPYTNRHTPRQIQAICNLHWHETKFGCKLKIVLTQSTHKHFGAWGWKGSTTTKQTHTHQLQIVEQIFHVWSFFLASLISLCIHCVYLYILKQHLKFSITSFTSCL